MSFVQPRRSGSKASSSMAEQQMRQWAIGMEIQGRKEQEPSAENLPGQIQPYVSISRETGAGGGMVARRIKETLGWEMLHRDVLDDMAERFNLRRDMLKFVDETTSNWFHEVFGKWIDKRVVTQSEYIVHLSQLVLMAARHARTVFVGRGAQFILPSAKGVRIYLVAPIEMRVRHICEVRECSEADARRSIRETDKGRRQFVKTYFNRDAGDPHLYDLVINRTHLGLDEAAEMIVDLCRRRFDSV